MTFTTDLSKEELVKVAEYYYAMYNGEIEDCKDAIEKDVQCAMENRLEIHEWEEYTVRPHAEDF